MKSFFQFLLYLVVRFLLVLRYRIKVRGKETLTPEALSKPGGIVFLANHPAEIDPLILITSFWHPFRPRPIAIDYLFRKPFIRPLLDFIGAMRIPNFDSSSNSYKRREMEKTYAQIYAALNKKENLLIYPAGGLKNGPEEVIGGSSGVHTILANQPDVNVVLIRTSGLWGSTFSRAPTGKTPEILETFVNGFKVLLRNGIFFTPRREVLIECMPAPEDFPWLGDRRAVNRYLEKWYNARGPEPLKLVSFSRFRKEFPAIKEKAVQEEIAIQAVPEEIKQKVIEEIIKLTRAPHSEITPESHLAQDLGLDSLDIAQLVVSLKDHFGIDALHSSDLTTVGSVFAFAAKLKTGKTPDEMKEKKPLRWEMEADRKTSSYPEGETIPELFFKTCERMGKNSLACADQMSGEVSYKRLKLVILLFAEAFRKIPEERIGIMMPASIAVNAMILAVILAGKIPVMINWTLGERNLRSIAAQSGIKTTLSSWNFLDRLDNVELGGIDDQILLLEELRRNFTLGEKLKAFYRSRKKTKALLKCFGADQLSKESIAVILFTSGTESFPKGVPLSHHNIISNQKGAFSLAELKSYDVLLGALPPFHSFGFSVTGLLPLLAGLRVAYAPNPTDGRQLAETVERWKVTLLCLAPTFLKNVLRTATEKQLRSLALVVAGAEKAPQELYEKLFSLNSSAKLMEGYGITECSPILTLNPPNRSSFGVGIPLPGVELKIVNPESHEPLPIGKQGLILARGPNVFKGYLDPKIPSPFIAVENRLWYQTGDLGFLNPEGYLMLSGRLKRFVKIGGEMVSLIAIEETLLQAGVEKGWKLDPDVPSLAVCAQELEGKKGEIHLFTIFDTTLDEVNRLLRDSGMSNIIKIRSIRKVPFIPLLGTGKVDYRTLLSKL